MSLSSPADFKLRYDLRALGDLVGDTGTQVSSSGLNSDTVLQQMLDDAYAEMVTSLIVGQRYSETDLTSLTGASLNYAKRIECDIALDLLYRRRLYGKKNDAADAASTQAIAHLKNLSQGIEMFNVVAQMAASVPVTTGPTTTQLTNLNTIRRRTGTTSPYFPTTPLPGDR